jgi:protein-arginine kinase activator protein McsA
MLEKNEWRLTNQESYLLGKKLSLKKFVPKSTDHVHCEFCWKKIMDNHRKEVHREAYTTQDEHHWVCKNCYFDFKDMFKWI